MKRLQFWKKKSGKVTKPETRPLEASFAGVYADDDTDDESIGRGDREHAESVCDVEPCSALLASADSSARHGSDVSDPEPSGPAVQWRRDPSLSFETFKGPQSTPSSSPDSIISGIREGQEDTASQHTRNPRFEVIYSQVNKNKQGPSVPRDGGPAAGPFSGEVTQSVPSENNMPKHEPVGANDVSDVSFDDVLESFRISLHDLQALSDRDCLEGESLPSALDTLQNSNSLPGENNYEDVETINGCPMNFNPERDTMDNCGVDLDLMMSDEIIMRPRKKSVTFNEHIQERPLSMGESDVTFDDVTGHVEPQRPLANGIDKPHANGVIHQNGHLANNTYNYNSEDVEITKINEQARYERETDKAIQSDDGLSVTSVEELTNEEEELLEKELIRISRLVWTRTIVMVFVWISVAIMAETITTSFPTTQQKMNVTVELLSRAHIARGTGCLLSAILTAVLCTYLSCDLFIWMAVGLVLVTVALACLPWCASIATVLTFYSFIGCGEFMTLTASIVLVTRLWTDKKRDTAIHVLFISRALASAVVPHVTRYLTALLGTWTLPGITYNVTRNTSTSTNIVREGTAGNGSSTAEDYTSFLITIVSVDIPALFPVYLVVSFLGVLVVVLVCVVLGYKQCQVSKRQELERKQKKLRKRKLKQQIKLVGPTDVGFEAQFYRNGLRLQDRVDDNRNAINGEIQEILSQVSDMKRLAQQNGNPHVDCQVAKLIEYANYLQSQSQTPGQDDGRSPSHSGPIRLPNTWLQGYQSFGVGTQMYLYVFFSLAGGLMLTFSQFLYIYAHHHLIGPIGYEDDLVFTLYWAAIAISRLITFPVSRLISPNAIMVTCLVTNMSSSAIMIAYVDRYPVLLWLFCGLIGASIGPLLPGGLTWANIYFNLRRPKTVGLVLAFWGVGAMLFPWCCGFVVYNWGYTSMFYMTLVTAALAFVLYIPVLITISKRKVFDLASARSSMSSLPNRTYL